MKSGITQRDDTKVRLLEAAGEVFADHGYRSATVREICKRAGTHVGAVNYHFRDKMGLYKAVIEYSYKVAASKYPPDLGLDQNATAQEKLGALIRSFLLSILAEGFPAWHGKLMAHEIGDPGEALAHVAENSIRPLYEYLSGVVRDLLRQEGMPEDQNEEAAFFVCMSIAGQCLYQYIGRHVMDVLRPASKDSFGIERLAEHITQFTLGGIQELARASGQGKRTA